MTRPGSLKVFGLAPSDDSLESWRIFSSSRTIQNQQLMFGQNGFRHDSAHTSGLDQPEHCRDEMDNKNNQIANEEWYSGPQATEFGANLEFATVRSS